jgi:hypothetical protein
VHGEQEPFGKHDDYVVRLQRARRLGLYRRRQHGQDQVRDQGERRPRSGVHNAIDGARGESEALAELGQLTVARVFQVEPEEPARLQMARDLARSRRSLAPRPVKIATPPYPA